MKKFKKSKHRNLYISLAIVLTVLVVTGLSVFAIAEVNRSKDCVNAYTSNSEKVRRCANGYVGRTIESAEQKAGDNNLASTWYGLGDKNYIIPDTRPLIIFEVKYGIVVNAHMNH